MTRYEKWYNRAWLPTDTLLKKETQEVQAYIWQERANLMRAYFWVFVAIVLTVVAIVIVQQTYSRTGNVAVSEASCGIGAAGSAARGKGVRAAGPSLERAR